MNAVETGLGHQTKIRIADPGDGMGPGIGCDSLYPWKAIFEVAKDREQPLWFDDQAVGILEKDRPHTVHGPMEGRVQGRPFAGFRPAGKGGDIASGYSSGLPCVFPNELHIAINRIDILKDMVDRSEGKSLSLIDRTEGAAVPGAISGHPDEQACRLAGRPDRALLETAIRWGFRSIIFHWTIKVENGIR
jgi:hypothetical protein